MFAPAHVLPVQTPLSLKKVGCWQAQLSLGYSKRADTTIVSHKHHHGPLTVQRPFYPEKDVCHSYLLHPPGGMVGGDHINLNVAIDTQAHALLTTPSAGKIYRSVGESSVQYQHFSLAENATLEWLPQEMIVFNGAKAQLKTHIELAEGARFIGWDILCLGRPASQDYFNEGTCMQSLHIYRQGIPVLLDRFATTGTSMNRQAQWGMAGYNLLATFVATGADQALLEHVQNQVNQFQQGMAGITLIDDVLICRCLSTQARFAKDLMTHIWSAVRPKLLQKDVTIPRIWLT